MTTTVIVGAPAYLSHAVDSPEAFDDAARAALTFVTNGDTGADSAEGPEDPNDPWAECATFKSDGTGWHVGRSEAHAWPMLVDDAGDEVSP